MGKLRITPEVAKAIVDAGTVKNYKATQTVRKPQQIESAKTAPLDGEFLTSEFLTGLGEPGTQAVVVELSTETTPFLSEIEAAPVVVVVDVGLEITDDTSSGAVPVVVAIGCNDGELVVTTKYIRPKITSATIQTLGKQTTRDGVSLVKPVAKEVVARLPQNNPKRLAYVPREA